MPRKPTGRPIGRPPGTGILGPQTRFTVRIPTNLFERLEAYAEGRSYTRGSPQLARCVREAIEHYLVCPDKRQTRNTPSPSADTNGQTETGLHLHEENNGQTEIVPEPERTAEAPRAALIARLQAMRAEGLSLQKIADQLQAEGLPTVSGRGQWTKGSVDKLLRASTV